MAFEDYLSRTGYKRQFLDTNPEMGGAATPANPTATGREDLTNRLLQIMSGNLGGSLTGGERLSALGALLKSVSRGSQTNPQDVVRGIQQQKMAEVQGALQIQELRRAAAEKAQTDALKAEYVSQLSETNPQLARAIALMSPEKFSEFVIEQNKPQSPQRLAFDPLGRPRDPITGAIINPTARIQRLPTIASDEEYDALPSGTSFVDPEGNIRSKP
jgi:hypothetical protein